MRMGKFTLIAAAALFGAALMASPARSESAPLTTARFAVLIANFGSNDAAVGQEEALQRLRSLGAPLRGGDELLTEGELAKIMLSFGLRAHSSNPEAPVGETLANTAAAMITNTLPFVMQEKPRNSPPPASDVGVCLAERNHGQCVNCCKGFGERANVCAKFCMNLAPPSPSGP
jgi:hypothetical protein